MPGVRDTVAVFLRNRPSVSALLSSRHPEFGTAHCILPSDAVAGEPVTGTVQAWDGHERLLRSFEGAFGVGATDPDATTPEAVEFAADDGGVTGLEPVTFETPGVHYLELSRASGTRAPRCGSTPTRPSAGPTGGTSTSTRSSPTARGPSRRGWRSAAR